MIKLARFRLVLTASVFSMLAVRALADTPVSGTISTNTTWTVAGSPYVVTGNVNISGASSPILTINAGVTVKFNATASLQVAYPSAGVLVTNGTSTSKVLFTANGSTTPGFWGGIYFGNTATPSQLTHTIIEYGGYTPLSRGEVHVEGSSPTLTNCTIRNSVIAGVTVFGGSPTITGGTITANSGPGVSVTNGTATVTGATITNNTGYAISAAPNGILAGLTGLTVSGNGPGKDFIERQGGGMSVSQTWVKGTVPYAMTGGVTTTGPAPTLTIAAGVTVKASAGTNLVIGWPGQGTLIANGTSASPILLTANGSTTPGFWAGVYIGNGPTQSQLSYLTVEYGGWTPTIRGGIYVENASPTMDHVTVRNSAVAGMTLNGGSSTITASTVTANLGPGITVSAGSASITGTTASSNSGAGIDVSAGSASITTCTLTSNTGYAVSAAPSAILTGLTGLTVSGNGPGKDLIERRGGGMSVSQTWVKGTVPYAMTGSVTSTGPAPTLTIAAGVTVKASAGANLVLGWPGQGTLIANGTSASPILLTANGSTTPGFWAGIYLGNAPTQSQLSYVTVEYGGWTPNIRGGIYVENASPTMDHVTARNNAVAGMTLNGGSSTITASTVTGNAGPGITVTNGSATITGTTASSNTGAGIDVSGTSAAITTCTLTSNTGYAISAAPSSILTGLTGLTVSGNGPGKNFIERRGGNMTVSQTWVKGTVPYAMTGSVTSAGSPPTLTIAAGVTVKASAGANLVMGWPGQGTLIANGTAASPILLTANGSTTPGFWTGVYLGNAPTQSSMKYVTVEYAGMTSPYQRGGIYIENASPTIDHVTSRNNVIAGLTVNGGLPTLMNNSFTGNAAGLINQIPSIPIVARYHYWGAANGPSGSGPGTGQAVSTGVSFEPWLTAAGSQPNFYNSFTQKNRTFNPAIGVNTTITGGTVQSGNWTFTILNSGGTVIRTFTGTGTSGTIVWDGKNTGGTDQPDGTYNYQLASTSTGGNVATPIRGPSIIDRTKQLAVTNLAVSLPFFSPNADTVQDTTTVSGSNGFDDTTFTINVKKTGGVIVRTNVSVGLSFAYAWDGKNGSGVVQADGLYTFEVIATNGTASSTATITTTLDNTLPTASITAPVNGAVLSNIYTNGITDVAVTGSNADTNFNNWVSDFGLGSNPSTFTSLSSGSAPVTNGSLGTWATAPIANGLYTLRLRVWDKAGNLKTVTIQPTVGNFSVSLPSRQLNVGAAQSINYTSIVPFALNETLVIKNAAGTVVRTLLNAAPQVAGTINTPWNGKTAANGTLPDGPYFYVATVTAGTYTFVWDLTTKYWNDTNGYNDSLGIQPWDPFNNRPMTFSYNFGTPGRVSIGLSQTGPVPTNCNAPNFCLADAVYQESGPHTMTWAGVDATGALRSDLRHIGVVTLTAAFSKNALVVYGTKPVVTNLTVTPPVYGPAVGSQTVAFDLALYQLTPTTITIKFLNQASLSVLRTLTFPSQTAGHKTYTWDGKGDNGMWVAPGFYTVTVTASDAAGNSVSSQILTTIQY